MLIVWENLLPPPEQEYLVKIDPHVRFWPYRYFKNAGYNECIPIEWWISFSSNATGLIWLMHAPQFNRIIYYD